MIVKAYDKTYKGWSFFSTQNVSTETKSRAQAQKLDSDLTDTRQTVHNFLDKDADSPENVVFLSFTGDDGAFYCLFVEYGSVYLLNDNGKTIERIWQPANVLIKSVNDLSWVQERGEEVTHNCWA